MYSTTWHELLQNRTNQAQAKIEPVTATVLSDRLRCSKCDFPGSGVPTVQLQYAYEQHTYGTEIRFYTIDQIGAGPLGTIVRV